MNSIVYKDNCISSIRVLAATQVMLTHILAHLNITLNPILEHIIGFFSGVPIFFFLSGFLIWDSVSKTNSYKEFVRKRALRIFPELWVGILFEILIIVNFDTNYSIADLGLLFVAQGTIFQFYTPDSLRNFGCGSPNGSLWTICVFIQFYFLVWFLYKLMHNKKVSKWIMLLIGSLLLGGIIERTLINIPVEIVYKLYSQTILKYIWLFILGVCIAEHKDICLPILKKYWYFFLILGIIPYLTIDISVGYSVFKNGFLVSGLLGFSYRYSKLKLPIDISYGLFIYHMIIVNVYISINRIGKIQYALEIVIISLLLALFSTLTVGKWAARKKINNPIT